MTNMQLKKIKGAPFHALTKHECKSESERKPDTKYSFDWEKVKTLY